MFDDKATDQSQSKSFMQAGEAKIESNVPIRDHQACESPEKSTLFDREATGSFGGRAETLTPPKEDQNMMSMMMP